MTRDLKVWRPPVGGSNLGPVRKAAADPRGSSSFDAMSPNVPNSSLPTTPTLSYVSSSDMSFEDVPSAVDKATSHNPGEAQPHPTLFIRDMVTI
jgi:hypothetical protein